MGELTKAEKLLISLLETYCSDGVAIRLNDNDVVEYAIEYLLKKGALIATDDYGYIVNPNIRN